MPLKINEIIVEMRSKYGSVSRATALAAADALEELLEASSDTTEGALKAEYDKGFKEGSIAQAISNAEMKKDLEDMEKLCKDLEAEIEKRKAAKVNTAKPIGDGDLKVEPVLADKATKTTRVSGTKTNKSNGPKNPY